MVCQSLWYFFGHNEGLLSGRASVAEGHLYVAGSALIPCGGAQSPANQPTNPATGSLPMESFILRSESKPIMKAIQVKQPGGPEAMELAELPLPQPKPNEAVVKLAASGVNFIDVYFREGRYKAALPFVLGQEGAGVVTEVGSDVKSVKVGDRVAWCGLHGSYAQYAAVAADRLVPVPPGV